MFFSVYQFEDIDYYDSHYDKAANLLYLKRIENNDIYYPMKTEYAHHLMESIEYAMLLLRKNDAEDLKTADAILNTVLSFQDTRPQSSKCGLFPDYSENGFKSVLKNPDHSTTLKIIILFIQILMQFKPLLSNELISKIENACYTAAFYFSLCSNITVNSCSYTHFLEVYTLLQCGNLLKKADFFNLGIMNLNALYHGIQYNEQFWEYNAFYETYIISEMLMFINRDIDDANCTDMVNSLYDLLWKTIALNFHAGFCTATGPQCDKSQTFPMENFLAFLEKATGCRFANAKRTMQSDILSRCPKKYIHHFCNTAPNRFTQQLAGHGGTYFYFTISQIVSNYLQPDYAIGCFNREEFWYGHTPFVCYFRSEESPVPYCAKIKVLNNGHDYSSAELHCLQQKGTVLGHIVFCTNRGDIHPDLAPTHGKITTSDFRIRLEITGNINKLKVNSDNGSITVRYNNITIRYKTPVIILGNIPVKYALSKSKEHLYYDAVFSTEKNSVIDFLHIQNAVCQFTYQITTTNKKLNEAVNKINNGFISSELECEGFNLKLVTPSKPDYFEYLNTHDRQYVNGMRLEQYVAFNQSRENQYKFIATSNFDIDFPSFTSNDIILHELNNFENIPIKQLHTTISDFLNKLSKNDYTLDIFKRYSIHVVMMLFDRAKSEIFQFEKIINNNYFDIYQKISSAPTQEYVRKLILDIVSKLQEDYSSLDAQLKKQTIVSDVISIIDKNYQNPALSLTMISNLLGLSESYISRAFKNSTNTNYVKYLIRVRMEKAKKLLLAGNDVENVISQCGYLNIFSFKRSFKLYTGMTITEWLKHQKK